MPTVLSGDGIPLLDFTGVPFERAPIWALSADGTPYLRWVSFGMPKLGTYKWILDMVFFLYRTEEDALAGLNYGGTGFFVGVKSKRWPDHYHHFHGVSNWHVACRTASVIRVNGPDGKPATFPFNPDQWLFKPAAEDLAISPPVFLLGNKHKVAVADRSVLLTEEEERSLDINVADDVFMVGRFIDYDGEETKVPASRYGNISIMDARIKQKTGYFGRSIVVDMHSRSGFSGSPVFVYRTPGSMFSEHPDRIVISGHLMKLLGIHWGQFPERWELKDKPKVLPATEAESLITDGKYVDGLSGMTCVIPASSILALLDDPQLVAMREQIENQLAPKIEAELAAMPKPETVGQS